MNGQAPPTRLQLGSEVVVAGIACATNANHCSLDAVQVTILGGSV
jgi:hypothetical protein